ncbi:diacylglycerol kinase family protein [Niabella terrae]
MHRDDFLHRLIRSFGYAFRGLRQLLAGERNFQIHTGLAFLALVLAGLLDMNRTEFCIILLCIGMVLTAEALNTAIEKLADRIHPAKDPLIGQLKDIAAAGVLVSACVALIIGLLLFLPKIGMAFSDWSG